MRSITNLFFMLTKIEGVTAYVVAFKATGEVNKEDYDKILIPAIDAADKAHGHIHFLFVLETPVKIFHLVHGWKMHGSG